MDVVRLRDAEQVTERRREQHPQRQEVAEVDALGHHPWLKRYFHQVDDAVD